MTSISTDRLREIVEGLPEDEFMGFTRTVSLPVPSLRSIITELLALRASKPEVEKGLAPLRRAVAHLNSLAAMMPTGAAKAILADVVAEAIAALALLEGNRDER